MHGIVTQAGTLARGCCESLYLWLMWFHILLKTETFQLFSEFLTKEICL